MDITQGEFKDYYTSSRIKNYVKSSRASSRGSITCSMELLSPDEVGSIKEPVDTLYIEVDGVSTKSSESFASKDFEIKEKEVETIRKSKSFQSSSSDSPSTLSDNDTNEADMSSKSPSVNHEKKKTSEEIELEIAIKKMKKLDRILFEKVKHEKKVKRERLLNQRNFYSALEKLEAENQGGSEATSNTAKYLALLPPPQQLDVLLERHETTEEYQPIFQTQYAANHLDEPYSVKGKSHSRKESTKKDKPRASSSTERRTTDGNDEGKSSKPSSADSSKRRNKLHDKKTNFIERNIELAKDAGSTIAMTEEEKKRLGELLQDIDENDDEPLEEGQAFTQMIVSHGEGYTPEPDKLKQLQEIDLRLQAFLSPSGYNSISSTPRLNHKFSNTSTEMTEIGRKIAKSNLTETLSPAERLGEIDEKLSNLDNRWKEKFDTNEPRLTEDQLQRLLDECSRCTSPNSITTSNFSKLEFRDELSSTSSVLASSPVVNSGETVQSRPGSGFSRTSDLTVQPDDSMSIQSKTPLLEKDVLKNLLLEAKASLGITDLSLDANSEDDCSSALSHESDVNVRADV